MIKKLLLAIILIAIICISCTSDLLGLFNSNNEPGKIDFTNLQVGQQSKYIFFNLYKPSDTSDYQYEYFEDTLTVIIVDKIDDGFVVEEFYKDKASLLCDKYIINVVNDSVLFSYFSYDCLFAPLWFYGLINYGYSNTPLFVLEKYSNHINYTEDNLIDSPNGVFYNITIQGNEYTFLNKQIICIDNSSIDECFTIIYSKNIGIVKILKYYLDRNTIHGLELL